MNDAIIDLEVLFFGPRAAVETTRIAFDINDIARIEHAIDTVVPEKYLGKCTLIYLKDGSTYYAHAAYNAMLPLWKEQLQIARLNG